MVEVEWGFVSLFLMGGPYTAGNPRILISTICMAYVGPQRHKKKSMA